MTRKSADREQPVRPSHPERREHRALRRARRFVSGPRRLLRLGILAAAALGTLGAVAGTAQAVAFTDGYSSDSGGIAIASDESFALSNAGDQTTFKDSFTIRQYGAVLAATVRNDATAESVACSPDAPCRAVSLSFQVITMAGTDIQLNADNIGNADNVHCAGCQTVAGAYQFVVDTPGAFTLSPAAETQLAAIHRELDALSGSALPIADVQSRADALAAQVAAVLNTAAASSAEGPVLRPLTAGAATPAVRVYRDFQQN
jgi:hypothetical protein